MYDLSSSATASLGKVMSFQTSGLLAHVSPTVLVRLLTRLARNSRYGELEGVDRVAVFLVERPCDRLVEVLDRGKGLLGHVSHDRVYHLALVVPLLALDDILWRHPALREIDVACDRNVSTSVVSCCLGFV